MSASEVNRMANVKSIAHELLAKDILEGFKGKITGDNADYIVGENPENRYFVGKLLPVSDSQTSSWGLMYSSNLSVQTSILQRMK